MRLTLVVQRENGDSTCAWVTECADEYAWDEHDGMPPFISKALDVDPSNTRLLEVTIPDDALEKAFAVHKVVAS